MWIYNAEDLVLEVKASNFLEESGAYEVEIASVTMKDQSEQSKAVNIKVKTNEGQETTLFITYQDKEGKPTFQVSKLNQLCSIIKVSPDKFEQGAVGKKFGAFLKGKLSSDGKFINFDLDGVYNPVTKLTTKEIQEKATTPEIYNKMVEKYAKEEKIERKATGTSTSSKKDVRKAEANEVDEFNF